MESQGHSIVHTFYSSLFCTCLLNIAYRKVSTEIHTCRFWPYHHNKSVSPDGYKCRKKAILLNVREMSLMGFADVQQWCSCEVSKESDEKRAGLWLGERSRPVIGSSPTGRTEGGRHPLTPLLTPHPPPQSPLLVVIPHRAPFSSARLRSPSENRWNIFPQKWRGKMGVIWSVVKVFLIREKVLLCFWKARERGGGGGEGGTMEGSRSPPSYYLTSNGTLEPVEHQNILW